MKNKYLYLILLIIPLLMFSSCTKKGTFKNSVNENYPQNIYRFYCGEQDGYKIWIVDGAEIRREFFNEFLYGGNPERYTFVPAGEIWIDNSISAEEYQTTLAHELNERSLMAKFKMAYFDAHDSSLQLEVIMRNEYRSECREHEDKLKPVAPIDFDSTQEITTLPENIGLKNIYRMPYGERNGIKIWIVDGFAVRRDIYPDFGQSGNDMAYHFIPPNEIWIDSDVSCEETEYSIIAEMKERELMAKGYLYDDAYTEAVKISDNMRKEQAKLCVMHIPPVITAPLFRDTGTGKESTKIN
jgi:hypothetical protein